MENDRKEQQITVEGFQNKFIEFRRFFDKIDSEFNSLRHLLSTKATIKQIGEIREEMKPLATKEDFKSVKESITGFEILIG